MKHSGQLKRIIWAIDVLGEEELQINVASFLERFTGALKAEVWPVFVLSMAGIPGPGDRKTIIDYLPRTEEMFHGIIKKAGFRSMMPEKIIVQPGAGFIRNDVKALLAYAYSTHAQAIVVSTHAKKGVARFFLGSFAETLLLSSKIPIITINPTANITQKIRSILFPTDFGPESQIAFKSVIAFAKQFKAKIVLFHQHKEANEDIESNVLLPKGGKWQLARAEFLQKNFLNMKSKALAWQKMSRTHGVPCTSHFSSKNRNIADSANEAASALKVDMIAIASKKGPVASNFIGSTARWLVRSAPCPVWVLHVSK
ncbi:MAG: universal stress protein [Bdellovibrio sp.]|nr:universal stress protein [Bdellovibrio sp.]